MSNPNNLIRPPVLNTNQENQVTFNMADLQTEIKRIVTEAVKEQIRNLGSDINTTNEQDQVIDAQHRTQLNDLDRVPDVVRCLREFSGQPGEYSSWRKSVERILGIYQHLRGTAKYFGILSIIRNKIVGNADAVLESYNTPLNWESISRFLTLHYADKRDVSTLEYQMTSLIQGTETVQEFYQRVYNHLSLILNKISSMNIGQESLCLLTQTYRDKALDTFIRGLKGDLPRLLAMKEPTDLPKALHLCLKLENQNYRTKYAHNVKSSGNFESFPSRNRSLPNPSRNHSTFYPELAHIPPPPRPNKMYYSNPSPGLRNYQNQGAIPKYNQNNYTPQRPFFPKPQPRPEPMDIDQSIRTRNINYMNKPANNDLFGKRPPPQHPESKSTKCSGKQETDDINEYLNQVPIQDDTTEETLEDYMDGNGNDKTDYGNDNIEEIHFLD